MKLDMVFFDKKIRPSSISLSGSWQIVRYINENPLVKTAGYYSPGNAFLFMASRILGSIAFGQTCMIDRLKKVAGSYKLTSWRDDPTGTGGFKSIKEFFTGLNFTDRAISGEVKPNEIRSFLENQMEWMIIKNPSDIAAAGMMYELNQIPLPISNQMNYLKMFVDKNQLSSVSEENIRDFMSISALIQPSRRLAFHLIDDNLFISGPKLNDFDLAKSVLKNEEIRDLLNDVSEHPGINITEQYENGVELRAAGAIDIIHDEVAGQYYAISAKTKDEIASGIMDDKELATHIADAVVKSIGRIRDYKLIQPNGTPDLPKNLNEVQQSEAKAFVIAPLIDLGFEIFDSNGNMTDNTKGLVSTLEWLSADILRSRLDNFLSGKRAQKYREDVVRAKAKNENLFKWVR